MDWSGLDWVKIDAFFHGQSARLVGEEWRRGKKERKREAKFPSYGPMPCMEESGHSLLGLACSEIGRPTLFAQ